MAIGGLETLFGGGTSLKLPPWLSLPIASTFFCGEGALKWPPRLYEQIGNSFWSRGPTQATSQMAAKTLFCGFMLTATAPCFYLIFWTLIYATTIESTFGDFWFDSLKFLSPGISFQLLCPNIRHSTLFNELSRLVFINFIDWHIILIS